MHQATKNARKKGHFPEKNILVCVLLTCNDEEEIGRETKNDPPGKSPIFLVKFYKHAQ